MPFRTLKTRALLTAPLLAAAVTVPLLATGGSAGAAVASGPICCVSPSDQMHAAHEAHLHHLAYLGEQQAAGIGINDV